MTVGLLGRKQGKKHFGDAAHFQKLEKGQHQPRPSEMEGRRYKKSSGGSVSETMNVAYAG